jgi:integrase
MPHVTKGVSTDDALNLAFAWQWPVDLTKYDHPLTLTRQEREVLSEVVHRPRFPLTFPPVLTHLLEPMSDVLQLSTSVRMRCHAKRVLLLEMHQRQRPLWAWTPEEWAEILGATWQCFAGRYPKMPLCRQHVLLVGYLLCGFTDFHLLGGFTRESLAHMVFGRERMDATIERVNEGVRLWGLVNLHDMSLRSAVYEALLLNQNPYLEEITYEQLLLMRERTETLSLKRAVGKLSCALFQLGLLSRTLPHVPLPSEKRAQPVQHLLDGTATVAPVWLGYCQRWYETSTLTRSTRYQSYGFLLRLGRWLTVTHPEALHPGDWTREFAATVVAFINQLRFGEWTEPENAWRIPANKRGQPVTARYKDRFLYAVRAFFLDCQEWQWIDRRFDPHRCLATPRSIRALIGPDPRVIADDIWAKLLWAGLNLTQDDIAHWKNRRYKDPEKRYAIYPLEMVRAMTIVWLFCGIRSDEWSRLRIGCVRWQREDVVIPGSDEVLPKDAVCLLAIPTNKTGTAFTKPVDRVVGEAIAAWERVRPVQPSQHDPKTNEEVHFLFSYRGQQVAKLYINEHLIPMLCRKSGVQRKDTRGAITSHRARSTIATQLFNAAEPMSLFELQEWLGHRSISSTRAYAKLSPTKLARSKAKAEYFERNLRLIDVLIDQDVIRNGSAADGQPWRYYDLGHGLCSYDFFDTCPHRMACAKCSFYVPKGSSLEQIIEGKANLLRMKQELTLTEEEIAAVDDGMAALDSLQQKLSNVATPAGPTPRQLREDNQPTAFIAVQAVQRRPSKK